MVFLLRLNLRLTPLYIEQHHVTGMKGEEGRKAFFDNRSMSIGEGYKILRGAVPRLCDINVEESPNPLRAMVPSVLSSKRIYDVLPSILEMIQARMDTWGHEGQTDPFVIIPDLVFQMTIRMVTCRELAGDIDAVSRLQADFGMLEKSSTAQTLLLSWFPSKRNEDKKAATSRLYATFARYINARKEAKVSSPDTIDFLLDQGQSTSEIVGFILGTVFAGTSSAPVVASWILVFLSFHQEWKLKVLAELQGLLETHSDTLASDPLRECLACLPISAWENEMPVMDIVLRETMRISLNNTALRRNILEDVHVGKQTVPRGGFAVYPIWDTHMNPDIYDNPQEFDPERFGPGRMEDKKQAFAFLGWGAGRHPCAGMHVAKLEIKIFTALFLLAFDYEFVDASGNPLTEIPRPDYNDIKLVRPLQDCFIKFKRVAA
ncbi:hypothetical protein H0H92_010091 [Tricholoma furcatifolium]|nr:hypothetical protein H0H92_010091 [Tricholoma furcatifolium]